ncbi:MAG TPA: glycogen debranching protein GlgX [Myxococcaceae bacterium]|nr:glycogen debranching protein GlgX [Myxococcaceae bacterium]
MTVPTAVWPGKPQPLGATWDGQGVNVAVFSEWADRIDVCLYDVRDPNRETARITLPERTRNVRHGYLRGVGPGALYGLRAAGPYDPARGLRFNPNKLLVDPYARAVFGRVDFDAPVYAYRVGSRRADLSFDDRDSAPGMPRCIVVDGRFNWEGVESPRITWPQLVVYETHVKGFTMRHPEIPEYLRGTYGGFAHPVVVDHLRSLGVTAVELLPVHQAVDESFLEAKGLTNYWGYNTLGYFAPDTRYACTGPFNVVNEFKGMVKALHRAGIEVLLDVVYNHTGEGNHLGPLLSLKGLDPLAYYVTSSESARYFQDFTGTGNSLNLDHPQTLKLVMDSLRYWVQEMHVDGFRFDLCTTLGRHRGSFDRNAPFLDAIHQDPVLSRVKLIAEPWDVGQGGYQVGAFPVDFSEWNGKYRDAFRKYWKGEENLAAEIGYRLTGSADLYQLSGRGPYASINFVTAHDGFTLHDLVAYEQKHNEANLEDNKDGADDNNSWNCGVEGESDDPAIVALRERQVRNFLTTLLVSNGVPMLLGGDEIGRTQRGNNNAYCQDNEISWYDWNLDERRKSLLAFTRRLVRMRMEQPVLRRRRFFRGEQIWDSHLKDLAWFRPDGTVMTPEDWTQPFVRSLGYLLGGDAIATTDTQGNKVTGDTLLILMNANHEPVEFVLPAIEWGRDWEILVDTADGDGRTGASTPAGGKLTLVDRSMMVLRRPAFAGGAGGSG